MQAPDADQLERFVAERGLILLRTANLLTGSQQAAEDLLQAALERLLKHWNEVGENPEGYLRRIMYNLAADGWRRRGASLAGLRRLRASEAVQGPGGPELVDMRDALVRLMLQLAPRQRAVIVLRYWEGHSEAEVAELLGCSVGNVKSATSALETMTLSAKGGPGPGRPRVKAMTAHPGHPQALRFGWATSCRRCSGPRPES